ncbi:MAG: hypothetical protein K0U41_10070 [Gammaproteobacteria bacterium]|nr:hypothetical protein [Gammaproteobacteria bacterium]
MKQRPNRHYTQHQYLMLDIILKEYAECDSQEKFNEIRRKAHRWDLTLELDQEIQGFKEALVINNANQP